jgi:hypothetical protein
MMIEYQLIFNLNNMDQYMSHCRFDNTGYLFYGFNSMSSTGNWDKIYMFKYIMASSKFINGKMLSVTNTVGGFVKLQTMTIDLYSSDQWYAGQIRSSKLNMDSANLEAFILKLNPNMDYVYFRTFQGASN